MTATRSNRGAICLSSSTHLPPIENSKLVNPVRLPPGRDRLATNPWAIGSETCMNTIGTDRVACCNAIRLRVKAHKMASGARPTSSPASAFAPRPVTRSQPLRDDPFQAAAHDSSVGNYVVALFTTATAALEQ